MCAYHLEERYICGLQIAWRNRRRPQCGCDGETDASTPTKLPGYFVLFVCFSHAHFFMRSPTLCKKRSCCIRKPNIAQLLALLAPHLRMYAESDTAHMFVHAQAGDQAGTLVKAYDYKLPAITSVRTARGSDSGKAYMPVGGRAGAPSTVSIIGSGFGYVDTKPKARIGVTACNPTVWVSETSLKCTIQGEYPAFADYDVNVTVGGAKHEIFHVLPNALSSSSPTCADMLLRMPSLANRPGRYTLDPTSGSPSDRFRAHCAMGAEREDVLPAELGLGSSYAPMFWLDPMSGSSFDMKNCISAPLVAGWNENVYPLNHTACTSATKWSSRSPASLHFTADPENMQVLPLWKYDALIELPMLSFGGTANQTHMAASILRPSNNAVTFIIAFRAKGPGWIISDNDLQTTAPTATGVGIFLDDFNVPGLLHVRVACAAESGFMSAVPIHADDGVVHIVTLSASATSLKLWLDGSLEDGFDMEELLAGLGPLPDTNPNPRTKKLQLGRRATSPFLQPYFNGELGDVLVFDSLLPDSERQTLEHSLCVKWGARGCSDGHAGTVGFSAASYPTVMSSSNSITLTVERSPGGPAGRADGMLLVAYSCSQNSTNTSENGTTEALLVRDDFTNEAYYSAAIEGRDFVPPPSGSVLLWVHNETGAKTFIVKLVSDGLMRRPRSFSCNIQVAQASTLVTRAINETRVSVRDPVCAVSQTTTALAPCIQYGPTYWTGLVGTPEGSSGGGYEITVRGEGFGQSRTYSCEWFVGPYLPATPPASRSLSTSSRYIDSKQIACRVPAWGNERSDATLRIRENGVGVPRYDANSQAGPFKFRFLPPMVTGVSPANSRPEQSVSVTITGRNFGLISHTTPLKVWFGENSGPATWVSDTSITATIPPGTGSLPICVAMGSLKGCSLTVSFTVNKVLNSTETEEAQQSIRQWLSYNTDIPAANILAVPAAGAGLRRLLLASTTTITMTVTATNVQDLPMSLNAQEISLSAGSLLFTASVDQSNSFAYDPPRIDSLFPSSHTLTVSGDADLVAITGINFGAYDSTPQASIGGTRCRRTTWVSNVRVTCLTPAGVGQNLPVSVTVSGRVGQGGSYSYRPQLTVTKVSASNGPVVGGGDLTIFGANFGRVDNSPIVRVGATSCASSRWLSDSSIFCRKIAPGRERALPVRVSVSLMEGSAVASYTYNAPLVTKIAPVNGPPGGSSTFVTVSGINFGLSRPATSSCYVGERNRPLVWISDTSAVSLCE
jgi:hypothetical protein